MSKKTIKTLVLVVFFIFRRLPYRLPARNKEVFLMKSTGVVRKLDDLGRITLPIELRRNLNIGEHDPLEIFVDDDRIILRKYEASDIFTGNMDELIDFHDKKVSKQSIMEMARLAGLHVIENQVGGGD